MNTVAIVQARMGSTRLPGKIMTELCKKPMLWHIVKRVRQSESVNEVVVATSREPADDTVEELAEKNHIVLWRGSQNHVLKRFYECASYYKADIVVRLTGDNALVDAGIIDSGIAYFKESQRDYIYYREGLPLGMAIEIFTYDALKCAYESASDAQCIEHVTPYLYKNPQLFQAERVPCVGKDYSYLRWTMDTERDKELISEIYKNLYQEGKYFSFEDILKEYEKHPQWKFLNTDIEQKKVTYQGEEAEN